MTTFRITCVLLAFASPALADPGDETIVVIDAKPDPSTARDRDRALGEAPFVSIVHADDFTATTSVADALGSSVGVQSRSLGGLGAYASISVRGAAPGHTAVLVDGVPLARIAAVTADLGRFSLDAFGEASLYRGAVPVELGGAGVGGALNLVTRLGRGEHGERVRVSLGGGSFGARHLRVHYGDDHARVQSATTIAYQHANGDYTYFNNAGTLLNAADDSYQVRHNNGFDQIDAASRVGSDRATGGLRFLWKQQGLPGTMTDPTLHPELSTIDVVADAHADAQVGAATARELAYVLVERQRLRDPQGELGMGTQDRGYLTLSGGASSTWHIAGLAAGLEVRADHFTDRDRTGARGELAGNRAGTALLAAYDWTPARAIAITPALRVDIVRTRPTPMVAGPDAFAAQPARWDTVPSPRLSARAVIGDDVALKTSAGWYVRLPTLIELFGDRGVIVGSPELRPERGPSLEAGAVWAPAAAIGAVDRILVETDVFGTRSRDTIAFVLAGGQAARAINIANAQTYGAELVASARLGKLVSLTANYTRLVTEQISAEVSYAGKALPRQPAHAVYARADVMRKTLGRRAALWLDTSWQTSTFLDQANLQRVPARWLVGAGARAELAQGLSAAVAVENLADVRIAQLPLEHPPRPDLAQVPTALADVAGFPLPGRSIYVSLDWSY
jgi:vitamin B12 transporter